MDADSGEELFALPLGGIIHSVVFSPEGNRLTAAGEDGSAKIWDSGTGQELLSLPRLSGMYDITYLSNGNLLTAGQDGTSRVLGLYLGPAVAHCWLVTAARLLV